MLGPAHYQSLQNMCGLTVCTELETPLGSLFTESEASARLLREAPNLFTLVSAEDDEEEHSLEMQFPFIRHVFPDSHVRLLPVLVGHYSDTNKRSEAASRLLSCFPDIGSAKTLVVVSSDFCHYGKRFGFTPSFEGVVGSDADDDAAVWEHIEEMDICGFACMNDPCEPGLRFAEYLRETRNTVCGREAILMCLELLRQNRVEGSWRLLGYDQSTRAVSENDCSVSYLAASFSSIK